MISSGNRFCLDGKSFSAKQVRIDKENTTIIDGAGKLFEKSGNFGFDAQNEEYCDMVTAGINDPTKVVRVALQDAASGGVWAAWTSKSKHPLRNTEPRWKHRGFFINWGRSPEILW